MCTRLDGIALAIELAAARVAAMSPAELARRLGRFRLLTSGGRVAIARHQTLRAAIDWSYELLSETEQRLLARLSVFSGGCTLEAAEAVCAGGVISGDDVFEVLARLVARSLVVADNGPETRYRLLETIREYGEERLAEASETETLRLRHARYYAEFTGVVNAHLYGPGQVEWGGRLAREHDNLLAAMAYALDTQNTDLAFELFCQQPAEAFQVNTVVVFDPEALLALPGATGHPGSTLALMTAGCNAASRGDAQLALALCDDALAAGQHLGSNPDGLEMMAATLRSDVASTMGNLDAAIEHMLDGARYARAAGIPQMAAVFLGTAAQLVSYRDTAAARQYASEGLALARPTGMPTAIVLNLLSLAAALVTEDPEQGRALLAEAVELVIAHDEENATELRVACVTAAQLGDWRNTLRVSQRVLLHHTRWGTIREAQLPTLLLARALAEYRPEVSAVLLGAPAAPEATTGRAPTDATEPFSGGRLMQDFFAFLAGVRRDTTELLSAALGDARLDVLRAKGAAMNKTQACAYARTHIDEYLAHVDE